VKLHASFSQVSQFSKKTTYVWTYSTSQTTPHQLQHVWDVRGMWEGPSGRIILDWTEIYTSSRLATEIQKKAV
jgi:hypothetical protein